MTRDTEQEVNPCKFVSGACIHCEATERGDCQGWVSSPKREWVGLTDEEIDAIRHSVGVDIDCLFARKFAQAIEARLKERNT